MDIGSIKGNSTPLTMDISSIKTLLSPLKIYSYYNNCDWTTVCHIYNKTFEESK
jgi:hypothetical protein